MKASQREAANALQEYRAIVSEVKIRLRCLICGLDALPALDFHHISPQEKRFNIANPYSSLGRVPGPEETCEEIQKTIVLCSNHHRLFHAEMVKLPDDKVAEQRRKIKQITRKLRR